MFWKTSVKVVPLPDSEQSWHRSGSEGGTPMATATKPASKGAAKPSTERIAFRLPDEVAERLRYWADKRGVSMNEYVVEAIVRSIAWENQDYPLPTLEQARLNQLIDEMRSLTTGVRNVEHVIVSGFDSLLGLAKGDSSYLLDEDGELV